MPTELAHIAQANRCQKVLAYLCQGQEDLSDWAAVLAFYKALHVIEAVFAVDQNILHGRHHTQRAKYLKSKKYQDLWRSYRPLLAAARVARYLEDDKGKAHATFNAYLPPGSLASQLLMPNLVVLEKTAEDFLSQSAKKALDRYK